MTVVIVVSWFLFSACLGLVQPAGQEGVVSVMFHPAPVRALMVSIVLAFAAAGFGIVMDKRHYREFALAAIGAGLTAWAMKTGLVDELLLKHGVASERGGMFYRLILDVLIWFGIGAAGYGGAVGLARITGWVSPTVKLDPSGPTPGGQGAHPVGLDQAAQQKPEPSPSISTRCLAVGFVFLMALILLKFLAQSSPASSIESESIRATRGPQMGQSVFAVFMAFFLSVWAVRHFFTVPVWVLLAGPPTVAVAGYLPAAQFIPPESLLEQSRLFVSPSMIFAHILPIQFVAIGSLAVMGGYGSARQVGAEDHPDKTGKDAA